jgi:hypothetical protein
MDPSGMIPLPSFMKTGTGVQAILRFYLSNLKGCNADITDERDLWCTPVRWAQEVYICIPNSMTIDSGISVTLRLL